jgi:hypothetical protein
MLWPEGKSPNNALNRSLQHLNADVFGEGW